MTDLCPAKNHLKILSYTQGLVKNTRLIGYLAWTAALGRKRAFTHSALSFLELLTIALTGKRFQVIWQLQLRVVGGLTKQWRCLPRAAD
jgi:hypothetical protein